MRQMLRPPKVYERVAMGRTSFKKKYIDTGRAQWVRDGRINRMPDDVVERLIEEDIAAAKSAPPAKPALPREAYLKGANARKKTGACV
jgi:hypothetical protein